MILGSFSASRNGGYYGRISSLLIPATYISIVPTAEKRSANSPDFELKKTTLDGLTAESPFSIGSGWKQTSRSGEEYLSISIDDPLFPNKIHCKLYKLEEKEYVNGGTHTLVWIR